MIQIPGTDLTVSDIGLGTVKAGITYETADELISAFLSEGGNLIDTARIYSDWIPGEIGRSERVVGDAIARLGVRSRVVLMTKGGHPDISNGFDNMPKRMSPADMRYDLEQSLRALQTDVIDIYVYHRDDPDQPVPEEIEVMETFRREGKIRWYACSNWTADRMSEADVYCKEHGYRGFICDQSLLNAGVPRMLTPSDPTLTVVKDEVYAYHVKNPDNVLMPFSSVAEGYFHRLLLKGEGGGDYDTEGNRAFAKKIPALQEKYGATITQVLLGYFRTMPFTCIPLFGPRDVSQLSDAMKAMEIPFTEEDYRL
ncbi:MAG: aldo/keto reductase [Blautia sp.]|nr:aldo/keto reductase [Blautia sp.]